MPRILIGLVLALMISGCEVYQPADPTTIALARYVSDEPPSITLLSMVNVKSGKSAHTAILINGSQQVLYDPAGTFTHPELPRAGDIHYGVTPRFLDYYERYHARFEYFVHAQKVEVSRATADQVLADATAQGQTLKMFCADSITAVLRPVPPFQGMHSTFRPELVRQEFAKIPGVVDSYVYENDIGKNREWEGPDAPPS